MAGLGAGYLLRKKRPIFLDLNQNFGGNSRGESWQGIQYSIGAAYLVPPENDHPLMTRFYGPLGVAKQWRVSQEGQVIVNGKLQSGFWKARRVLIPKKELSLRK